MKKIVSLFIYVAVFLFGLFIFMYQPDAQNEVSEKGKATQEISEQQIDELQGVQP